MKKNDMGLTKANFKKAQEPEKPPKFTLETSWDDGYALDIKVAILLKKYNLPGTFYIVVNHVGNNDYLGWEQIKALHKQGFGIGSHTMTHPSDLKACYDEDLHFEIRNSKDMIEAVLGEKITKFCYPRGRYDDRVKEVVGRAGYLEARTTGKPGIIEVTDKLVMPGTIHIFDRKEYGARSIFEFAKETIDLAVKEHGYVNIWGHSKEIQECKLWGVLEQVLDYAEKALH